jgi:hypothetical protein
MKWIDYAFYTENGGALDEETFNSFAPKAETTVDLATNGNLGDMSDAEFVALPVVIQDHVKKAIAAQIEYYSDLGMTSEADLTSREQSVSIGIFSYSEPSQSGGSAAHNGALSLSAETYLGKTGLLHSGVHCRG